MATETEPVVVRIIASQKDLEKSLAASVRSVERTAAKMEKTLGNIGGGGGTAKVVQFGQAAAKSTQQATFAAQQLSFQLNDIGTSLTGGASPFQVMMQQGSQVAQVMQQVRQQGGSMGSVVAAAFRSMLSPLTLLSFGLIAVAGYAYQYFTAVEEGDKDAQKALKDQRDLIRDLAKEWGEAYPSLAKYNDELERLENISKLKTGIAEETTKATAAMDALGARVDKVLDVFERFPKFKPEIAALRKQWEELDAKVKAGTATTEDAEKMAAALNATISKLPIGTGQKLALSLRNELMPALEAIIARIGDMNEILGKVGDTGQAAFNKMVSLTSIGPAIVSGAGKLFPSQTEMEQAGEEAAGAYATGLVKFLTSDKPLSHANLESGFAGKLKGFLESAPDQGIKIYSGRRSLQRQQELYAEAIRKYGRADLPGHQVAAPTPEAPHVSGRAADLKFDSEAVKKWAHDNAAAFGLAFNVEGEYWHISEATTAKAAKAKKTDLDDWNKKLQESIALQKQANTINQDTTRSVDERKAAIEEEKLFQQGLNEAIAQYGVVSAAQRESIRATAHEAAALGLVADQIATAQKTIAQQSEDQKQRAQEMSQAITQMAQSALGGFVNDLRNGVEAGEAFGNMLDRVVDSIIQFTIQQMFAKNALGGMFSSFLGGGFPGAPGVGGLYHGGGTVGLSAQHDGRRFAPGLWTGAPSYQRGGVAGLRPGEIPAILHKGELVIPRGARTGSGSTAPVVQTTSLGDVNIDMSQTGKVAATSEDAKQFGINVQKLIQREMVKESRPGGLLRQVP